MILYVVEIYNYRNNDEWETVNIWKTRESAEKAINEYSKNWHTSNGLVPGYRIVEINTNIDSDCIYDVVSENGDE